MYIRRDIKASNFNAKIANFGLAQLYSDDQRQLITQILGTM
jgi:hypothetical protein